LEGGLDVPDIKGVEIFAVGTWNGDVFTSQDLDEMVLAFDANKATLRPFLKLGHNEEQTLKKVLFGRYLVRYISISN
jgi:hypothetical protein